MVWCGLDDDLYTELISVSEFDQSAKSTCKYVLYAWVQIIQIVYLMYCVGVQAPRSLLKKPKEDMYRKMTGSY